MKIEAEHKYKASADDVFAALTDEDALVAKHEKLGARNITAVVEEDGDALQVTVIREVPADVPGVLQRFLKPWNRITQAETWQAYDDGSYAADLTIDIENVPVSIAGSLNLQPRDGGCVNIVELDVGCSIPLVGGKLAAFVGENSERLIAAEYRYLKKHYGS